MSLPICAVTYVCICFAADAGPSSTAPVVARHQTDAVRILSEDDNAGDAKRTVKVRSDRGIFWLDLALHRLDRQKLVLIVEQENSCEGLSFAPAAKDGEEPPANVDLLHLKGASINADGADCVITIDHDALRTLGDRGRLQFINAYRR